MYIVPLLLLAVHQPAFCGPAPRYVWPLGDSTVHKEVMAGMDAHLPVTDQCFSFSDAYPGLPYRALILPGTGSSFVDFYLNGKEQFTDLALSLYVYPIGQPEGVILNYLCETGNVIKVSIWQGLLFLSFWDEFGVSLGATATPQLLQADTWAHLMLSRQFDSGRIKIYLNGEVVDDIDDDFPNQIRLPNKGSIRLGSSQKEREEPKFKGHFSCFQFYSSLLTAEEVKDSQVYCLPEHWKIIPEVSLEVRSLDGQEKECLLNYVPPYEDTDVQTTACQLLDMACLASGLHWNSVLSKYHWTASKRDSAYFHLIARDRIPVQSQEIVLADVLTSDPKICSRVCLRVMKCQAFSAQFVSSNTSRCLLYSTAQTAVQAHMGAVYFSLLQNRS